MSSQFPAHVNDTIVVMTPFQEQAQSTVVVEQGRPVRVRCYVPRGQKGDSIMWYKIVDGVRETGETRMKDNSE